MNIYRLFRTLIPRTKPKWAAPCRLVYTDTLGRRYYQYQDEMDMTIFRRGELEKCQMELRFGTDYASVIDGIKDSLNRSNKKTGRMEADIVTAGYLTQELIDRKDLLLIPDILFRICANTLIREDENPHIVDQEILDQKLETFKSEIQRGGLHAFFLETGLLKSAGISNISQSDFSRLMTDSEQRLKQVQARIRLFTSEQRSHDSSNSNQSTTLKNAPQKI